MLSNRLILVFSGVHLPFLQPSRVISQLWFVPINFFFAGGLMFAVNSFTLQPWRKAANAHWTERARQLWPARKCAAKNVLWIPLALTFSEHDWRLNTPLINQISPLLAGILGAVLATFPLSYETLPRITFQTWLRLVVISYGIRTFVWAIFVLCIVLMPDEAGFRMILVAIAYLVFALFWSRGLYTHTMRAVGILKNPDARLNRIVSSTAHRLGVSAPCSWLMDVPLAVAYALPQRQEIIISSRLLEILNDDEVSTICAHEMAHLSESKRVRAGRMITSLALFPAIFLKPAMAFGPSLAFGIGGLMMFIAFLGKKIGRSMEIRADKVATETQVEQGLYARALEKLYSDSLSPAVISSTNRIHPHLYDRMLAAGIQPDYPRPIPADATTWRTMLVWLAIIGIIVGAELFQAFIHGELPR